MFYLIKRCLLTLGVLAFASIAFAQQSVMRQYTVAQLPTASLNNGVFAIVKDGTSPIDCSAGGGSFVVNCVSNGTQWLPESSAASAAGTLVANNAAATGTTAAKLAKFTGAPATLVITATSDTGGSLGVCISGCGTSGSATIQTYGLVTAAIDNATVAGDYLMISSTTAGSLHDIGATWPSSGQVIGRVLSTNGAAGSYSIYLFPSEVRAATGAVKLIGTASITPTAINDGACTQQGTTITVTGANVGDPVSIGNSGTLVDGVDAFGKVTASNTVTIELCNWSGASATPASGTFTATVVH